MSPPPSPYNMWNIDYTGNYSIQIFNAISNFKASHIQKQGVKTGINSTPSSTRLSSWIHNKTKATASISQLPPCANIACPSGYSPATVPVNCSFLPCQYFCINNSNGLYWSTPCSNNV